MQTRTGTRNDKGGNSQKEGGIVYHIRDVMGNPRRWHARITNGPRGAAKADAAGKLAFRGFRGKYRLSWTDASGRTATRDVEEK